MTNVLLRALLVRPRTIEANLALIRDQRIVEPVPNLPQIAQGVLRMWHRILFRPNTIGTSTDLPVRATWRARLLAWRLFRFPCLLWERAIAPLDLSGLASSRERVIRHLLGAFHDGNGFAYDFVLLFGHAGALDELETRARAVVDGSDPRAEWLRDLVVYDGYHERLLEAVERAQRGDLGLSSEEAEDPDISFTAYLAWCASRPASLRDAFAAWRAS